jgi:hypothetical protein
MHRSGDTRRVGARRIIAVLGTATLGASALVSVAAGPAVGAPATTSFTTPGDYSWTVPAGVTTVQAVLSGAQGGPASDPPSVFGTGGPGASVTATLPVTPGSTLSIEVGGQGGQGGQVSIGGAGAGGTSLGGYDGGAGGGASRITDGQAVLAVAGGGGGATALFMNGGGGAALGQAGDYDGFDQSGRGGGGGMDVNGGDGGAAGSFTNCPDAAPGHPGAAGTSGQGGSGGSGGNNEGGAGGGGGGGYYGGGGGGGGAHCGSRGSIGSGGGGGGGSSFVSPSATASSVTDATRSGNGSVTLMYDDTVAPVDDPVLTPAPNQLGWDDTDVTVQWNWSDSGSGIDDQACTPQTTSSGEGVMALTASCSDLVGNRADGSVEVRVDKTLPSAAPTTAPEPGPDGWNRGPVTVTWNWTDSVSGTSDTCPAASTSSGEGMITLSATCADLAGNEATESADVLVDSTPPVISIRRPQHRVYVRGTHVRASYHCSDALSGVATCRRLVRTDLRIGTQRLGTHHFTVLARDTAGNRTHRTVAFRVVRGPGS